ncbi:MAG: hypothetical protein K2K48_04555 [Anaeroplasmataceae bacterium]|nr:hypothetical protein [Anaeroplasmataceae bacterium]MDE6414664.1 hypothetical protein [Anaeroplasmataceae bacterium]
MKNPFKTYSFWIKILAAALLITLGVWLIIDVNTGEKFATFIVLMFTGLVAGVFAIIRAIPLMRTLKTGKGRLTCIIEIAVHIGLAAGMIFAAIAKISNEDSQFADFVYQNYRFAIALFFYTRVVSYFVCTVLCKEETKKLEFWIHIGILTLTCVICAVAFKGRTIAWIIAVLALCCSVFLIAEGGIGYNRYRKAIAKEREEKKQEQSSLEEGIEAPADEELIIPMNDDEVEDTIHIH